MVSYAFIARLDPAQSRDKVAAFSLFSGHLVRNALKAPEKRENAATLTLLCAGFRHSLKLQTLDNAVKKKSML